MIFRYNRHRQDENIEAGGMAKYYTSNEKLHSNVIDYSDKKENNPVLWTFKKSNEMCSPNSAANFDTRINCKKMKLKNSEIR